MSLPYRVEPAKSDRSTCKACKEKISKGDLRFGSLIDLGGGHGSYFWRHLHCITAKQAANVEEKVGGPEQVDGFEHLDCMQRKELLHAFKMAEADGKPVGKRRRSERFDAKEDEKEPPTKRKAVEETAPLTEVRLKKGERVWTHFRVKPKEPMEHGGVDLAKSVKPELGMIREEEREGTLIIQFESKEDERERLERFHNPKLARVRAWSRFPRTFDGAKMKIPVKWVVMNRRPPRLCSCKEQAWNHACNCGISCGRGVTTKVWGICN